MNSEAQFNTEFGKWVRYCYEGPSAGFELKFTKKDSVPFTEFTRQEQQLPSIQACSTDRGVYHKISDDSRGAKPFDCFVIKQSVGYFVIMYHEGRGSKEFVMIDGYVLEEEMNSSERKSLTRERAYEIGTVYSLK